MTERISSKNSQLRDYINYTAETSSKISPRSNLNSRTSQQNPSSRYSYYDNKIPSERFSSKLTPFREESIESVDTVIKATPIESTERNIQNDYLNQDYILSRRSNVQSTKNIRYKSDESENLDDTLTSKTSLSNPKISRNSRKYRDISPKKGPRRNLSFSKRFSYYDQNDDYNPKKHILRQRYPSYDSFTQNNKYIPKPRNSYKRRHLNVAGDNIVSKSLTRNYIYHRQPFDWYNSSSGILLDDVEEIIPLPGGLEEPHLNAPYEKSSSEEHEEDEYEYDRNNQKNNHKNNLNDSQEEYYEKEKILTKKNANFDDLSEFDSNSNDKHKQSKPDKEFFDYEREREKKSQVFSDDEKKVNQIFLDKKLEQILNESNYDQSENVKDQVQLKPQNIVINAQTVTINADEIKTNIPENNTSNSANYDNGYNIGVDDLDILLKKKLNNILDLQTKNMMQNYLSQQLNQQMVPFQLTNPILNSSVYPSYQPVQPVTQEQKTLPIRPASFQPKLINKKSDDIVKNILKDVVSVAAEDAKKIIDGNPFDESTNVYKMIHRNRSTINKGEKNFEINNQSESNKKLVLNMEKNKDGIDIFTNSNLVKSKNQTKNLSKPDKERTNKLTIEQTEKLNKLCEDIRILSVNTAKKLKKV